MTHVLQPFFSVFTMFCDTVLPNLLSTNEQIPTHIVRTQGNNLSREYIACSPKSFLIFGPDENYYGFVFDLSIFIFCGTGVYGPFSTGGPLISHPFLRKSIFQKCTLFRGTPCQLWQGSYSPEGHTHFFFITIQFIRITRLKSPKS